MKRSLISMLMASTLVIQPVLSSVAMAQSASLSEAQVCELAAMMKSKVAKNLEEEKVKTTELKGFAAYVKSEIGSPEDFGTDKWKDKWKDRGRVFGVILAMLMGEWKSARDGAVQGAIDKGEDYLDMQMMESALGRANAAVQRQEKNVSDLESILSQVSNVDCKAQAQTLGAAVSKIAEQRAAALSGSLSVLKALEGEANAGKDFNLTNSKWKRPGYIQGLISAVSGMVMLTVGFVVIPKQSILMRPLLLFLGAIAGLGGTAMAYTSAVEVSRALEIQKAELALLKSEIERKTNELTNLKQVSAQLVQSLN